MFIVVPRTIVKQLQIAAEYNVLTSNNALKIDLKSLDAFYLKCLLQVLDVPWQHVTIMCMFCHSLVTYNEHIMFGERKNQ